MKKSLALILLLTFFAIPTSNANDPAPPGLLYIYSVHNLPADIKPLYISGDSVLAFGTSLTVDGGPGRLLPFGFLGGDYYIMKILDWSVLKLFKSEIRYAVLGDALIFKSSPQDVEKLSKYGWGLTRLVPIERNATPGEIRVPTITTVDSNIVSLISAITPQSSRQPIADLSGISTRYSYTEGCRQAEQYIFNKFDSLGLTTSFFNFQYSGTDMRDVIGQQTGTAHPESIIIVCSHLDCTSDMPTLRAPGAEDNGTGTSVVLEAARVMSNLQMDLTVRFVTFSGEEQGLIGSDRYAAFCQGLGDRIAAVIDADMVGYSGSYAQDMHIFSDPASYSLGAMGAQIVGDYTGLDTVSHYASAPQYGSDHYPFAVRGYPAIFFIDAWQGFDWYPYYHIMADTLGNLNMNQQAAIGQAVTAMAAILARPHFVPQYLPGDANGSGSVTGLDVVFLVSYLKGGPAPDPVLRGDVNGDCATTGLDVVYLVNYLKGGPDPVRANCK